MNDPHDELKAERAELVAANEQATGWGAAVGARCERIAGIDAVAANEQATGWADLLERLTNLADIYTADRQGLEATAFKDAVAEIERLRNANRRQALQVLASEGQAQDAYEAQLKAEAEIARLKHLLDDPVEEVVETLKAEIVRLTAALELIRDTGGLGRSMASRKIAREALNPEEKP